MEELGSREEELKKLIRFKDFAKIMYFRSDVYYHSKRVYYIVKYLNQFLKNNLNYDSKRAEALALVHDDEEIITGDIMAYEKVNFSKNQKEEYLNSQIKAYEYLSNKYEKEVLGYNYLELLKENHQEKSIEYRVVDFADKFDAHIEVCHEILSGNVTFLREVKANGSKVNPYDFTFTRIYNRLEKLKEIFQNFSLELKEDSNFDENVKTTILINNFKDLKKRTTYEPYLLWLEILENYANEDDINQIIIPKEYKQIKKGIYEHYKGKKYEVLGETLHTETNEILVLYKPLYEIGDQNEEFNENPIFARPKNMFEEEIIVKNNIFKRFKLI